jgi:hypothetical protein
MLRMRPQLRDNRPVADNLATYAFLGFGLIAIFIAASCARWVFILNICSAAFPMDWRVNRVCFAPLPWLSSGFARKA